MYIYVDHVEARRERLHGEEVREVEELRAHGVHGLLRGHADLGGSTLFVTAASTETLNGTILGVTVFRGRNTNSYIQICAVYQK